MPITAQMPEGQSVSMVKIRPAGEMHLPANRDAWTYMASPVVLQCVSGEVVPRLLKAWHTPGRNGNGRDDTGGAGAKANLLQLGFVEVPHDFPCTAFGGKRPSVGADGQPVSTYLARWSNRSRTYYENVWRRPRQIGHITRWTMDMDGWLQFLCDIRDRLIAPGGLVQDQVDIAVEPLLAELDDLQGRTDERAKGHIAQRLRQLPRDHWPAWADHEIDGGKG